MEKIFFNSLAIMLLLQPVLFAYAVPLSKVEKDGSESHSTSIYDDKQFFEELKNSLSPEGQKTWQEINLLHLKLYAAANKTAIRQQIYEQVKNLSDKDTRVVFDTAMNFAKGKASREIDTFFEAIKNLSLEGKKVFLGPMFSANTFSEGFENRKQTESIIRELGEEDRETFLQAVLEMRVKSESATTAEKTMYEAIRKMSPEGKRLMTQIVFSAGMGEDENILRAKIGQLSAGDRKILADQKEKEITSSVAAKNREN